MDFLDHIENDVVRIGDPTF